MHFCPNVNQTCVVCWLLQYIQGDSVPRPPPPLGAWLKPTSLQMDATVSRSEWGQTLLWGPDHTLLLLPDQAGEGGWATSMDRPTTSGCTVVRLVKTPIYLTIGVKRHHLDHLFTFQQCVQPNKRINWLPVNYNAMHRWSPIAGRRSWNGEKLWDKSVP